MATLVERKRKRMQATQTAPLLQLDDELLSIVFAHVDELAFPTIPFVCHQFNDVERKRRETLPWRELRKPIYAAQRDYVAALIKARLFHVVLWSHDMGCEMPTAFCYRVAKVNSLELLLWARGKGYPWTIKVTMIAAQRGYLSVLKWAVENGCYCEMSSATQDAAENGHLETLQWLYGHFNDMGWATGALAAERGHVDVVEWVVGVMGEKKPKCIIEYAAKNHHHQEMIKWLFAQGCPITLRAMAELAHGGHLDTLKWAYTNGGPLSALVCSRAALGGHFEVLEWLRSQVLSLEGINMYASSRIW